MRKAYKKDIVYSVVPFCDASQLFLTASSDSSFVTPANDTIQGHSQSVPDYPRQIRQLLEDVRELLLAEGFRSAVVMSNFHLADIRMKELLRQLVTEIFPEGLGALTIVPQAPANGSACGVEIWAIAGQNVSHRVFVPNHVVTMQTESARWFFGGNFRAGNATVGAYSRAFDTFRRLGSQLRRCRMRLEQVLRMWIYQGHLLLPDKKTPAGVLQRYQELNRARTDFFGNTKFLRNYLPEGFNSAAFPASTGIGADDVDVVMSAISVDVEQGDFIAVPLENPNQTSAFSYGANYSPQSPKFARGVAVSRKNWCQIFVSGTASITNSESRFDGDPASQTEQTLNNIATLIDGDNLAKHGINGFKSGLDKLECVRVYVKYPKDFNLVQKICEKHMENVPILYSVADVCRPELLVEIEGFAVTTK
ncbi:MAG: hypothetical protein LBQ66_01670 [Planctomycetaceae bacterium]|jgi:enamine deaminase RidA (YjgF/YER057c/UK114 family)|nr:hypothetical protein [Planctomycetaceae bacterium]